MSKKASKSGLYQSRIDLSPKLRVQVCEMLNQSLANTFDLYSQVKQAHWNVKGPQFYQLHLLFDELADELLSYVDEQAERITALGGTAMGTVHMAAQQSKLEDYPLETVDGLDHVALLSERFSHFCQIVRENIDASAELGDADTADLFTEISRNSDKRLWFLEAHLQEEA